MALKDIKGREITKPVYIPTAEGEIDLQSAVMGEDQRVGDLSLLLTVDKDNLVEALNELFTNASDGKLAVKSAIAGKQWGAGLPADPTFTDLANKILAVLDRNGDNASVNNSVSGINLKLTPPAGHYDGVSDKVVITDPDFVASNIKNGVDLFGIIGSFAGAGSLVAQGTTKRWASTLRTFAYADYTSAGQLAWVEVTGLAFTPKVVVVCMDSNYVGLYVATSLLAYMNSTYQPALGNYLISRPHKVGTPRSASDPKSTLFEVAGSGNSTVGNGFFKFALSTETAFNGSTDYDVMWVALG